MTMHIEPVTGLNEVVALLGECGLPASDIRPLHPPQFFGIRTGPRLTAVIGIELYGTVGLLRSLAVAPAFRGRGLGRKLVAFAEGTATSRGVKQLFLLTTNASGYFARLGYIPVSRASAPPAIQVTSQFSELCSASSALLGKDIDGPEQPHPIY